VNVHQDSMAVWITKQYSHQRECRPWFHQRAFPESESDDTRESPERLYHGDECSLADCFAEARNT
jgi:hypothetical protein